ncbi:MAG: lysophospholipid acyltransferase family protein [Betaproteobacteria bacterium]
MLIGLMRLLARAPLSWTHSVGAAIGWIVYFLSPSYASRLRENLLQSGVWHDEAEYQRLLRENVAESGKAAAELIPVWFRPVSEARTLVASVQSLSLVEEAERRGKGIIYLTPHLGCFDVAALWLAQRKPITVLYRPPKMQSLQPLIEIGRGRDSVHLAPVSLTGVRRLLKALRRNEAIGILPDQVPGVGEGAWADFFGRPAFTMTLVGRLVEATGAAVIMTAAQRLPNGRGYSLDFALLETALSGQQGVRGLNAAIEQWVRSCPAQYLWSYNRYKAPAGATPSDAGTITKGTQG